MKTKRLVAELCIWNRIVASDRADFLAADTDTDAYDVRKRRFHHSSDTLKEYEIKAINKGILKRSESHTWINKDEL
jgi:hypothetical protein